MRYPNGRLVHFTYGSSGTYSGFDRFGRVTNQKWVDYGSSSNEVWHQLSHDRVCNPRRVFHLCLLFVKLGNSCLSCQKGGRGDYRPENLFSWWGSFGKKKPKPEGTAKFTFLAVGIDVVVSLDMHFAKCSNGRWKWMRDDGRSTKLRVTGQIIESLWPRVLLSPGDLNDYAETVNELPVKPFVDAIKDAFATARNPDRMATIVLPFIRHHLRRDSCPSCA